MNSINKKLRELESKVLDDTPKTETVLRIDDPVEHRLHMRAMGILQRQHAVASQIYDVLKENPKAEVDEHALDLSPEEQLIVDRSERLYTSRVMELFDNGIAQCIHLNDPVNKWLFYSRFYWFLSEMRDWLYCAWREEETYNSPGFFDLCAGEQERLLEPVYKHWRKWLTEESWSRYYEEHCKSKSLPEMTPEEIAEDERLTAQENAEAEAKEAKFLKEKCSSCAEKCKWFREQTEKGKAKE
jgi:hypothetical protein